MSDTLDDERDNHVGDLTNTDENPVLKGTDETPVRHRPAPTEPLPHVLVNYSLARQELGTRCIQWGRYRLSATEATTLAIELTDAADHIADSAVHVADLRAKLGFDT